MGRFDRLKAPLAARLRDRFANGRFRVKTVLGAADDAGLPVVMCAWARISMIEEVLDTLDAQEGAPPLDLSIWNNRRREHAELVRRIRSWQPRGALRSVEVVRSPFNLSSVARFYLARRLWLTGRRGPFVVFDDDQRLPQDFIATAVGNFQPGTASGVWAWQIVADYWSRRQAEPGEHVDHLGPGGMIADLDLVRDRAFFDALPIECWSMDDIWFSHYAPAHGIRLRRLPTEVRFVDDDHNMHPHLVNQKIAFHERLRDAPPWLAPDTEPRSD